MHLDPHKRNPGTLPFISFLSSRILSVCFHYGELRDPYSLKAFSSTCDIDLPPPAVTKPSSLTSTNEFSSLTKLLVGHIGFFGVFLALMMGS